MPMQRAVIARDDLAPRRFRVGGESAQRDGGAVAHVACNGAGFAVPQADGVAVFLKAFAAGSERGQGEGEGGEKGKGEGKERGKGR